jgi:hypothetical protein
VTNTDRLKHRVELLDIISVGMHGARQHPFLRLVCRFRHQTLELLGLVGEVVEGEPEYGDAHRIWLEEVGLGLIRVRDRDHRMGAVTTVGFRLLADMCSRSISPSP